GVSDCRLFPTRRSSDLPGAGSCELLGVDLALLSPRLFLRLSEQRVWLLRLRGGLPHVSQQDVLEREERPVVALRRDRGRVVRQIDRKSTRLNSSHVKIS